MKTLVEGLVAMVLGSILGSLGTIIVLTSMGLL